MSKIYKKDWPPVAKLHNKIIKRIYVGKCPANVSLSGCKAHAHSCRKDPYFGAICFRTKKNFGNKNTLLHELAHLMNPHNGKSFKHGIEWQSTLKQIGGNLFKEIQHIISLFDSYD